MIRVGGLPSAILRGYKGCSAKVQLLQRGYGLVGRSPRALKGEGLFFANSCGKGDHKEGKGRKIEPGTYICDSGIEAGMPHHFFTRQEVETLLERFEIMTLKERSM